MEKRNSALFFLRGHNEVDQISPVLYKIGERENISVDVVLTDEVGTDDYRLRKINKYPNVSTHTKEYTLGERVFASEKIRRSLQFATKRLPSRLVGNTQSSDKVAAESILPDELSFDTYSVVVFDWSLAKSSEVDWIVDHDSITTVVLPHGDSPFRNRIETERTFQRLVRRDDAFTKKIDLAEIYQYDKSMLQHDYLLFPNKRTASRVKEYDTNAKIRVFGSPRYNAEWLDILSDIRPTVDLPTDAALKVVFFLRRPGFFISVEDVKNTLTLIEQFPGIHVIIKEHPRVRLLDPSVATDFERVEMAADGVQSASLIEWGDVFLSLGTTITFEPVMRRKPVLALEYAHGNHTTVSDYFSDSDMRSKDDLYYTIHDLITEGTSEFYDDDEHRQFVEEIVTSSNNSVLDSWAAFIEEKTHAK